MSDSAFTSVRAGSPVGQIWNTQAAYRELEGDAQWARFAEIMRLMDRRYTGLSLHEVKRWFDKRRSSNRIGRIIGCFRNDQCRLDDLLMVVAMSSRITAAHRGPLFDDQRLQDPDVHMVGVAFDLLPAVEWNQADIENMYAVFVNFVKDVIGLETTFTVMRPETMTWKPMQAMHDCIPNGVAIDNEDATGRPRLRIVIDHARDRGDAVLWKLRVVRCEK